MNIYKKLLEETPELFIACDKLNIYTHLITFDEIKHLNLGTVLEITTINKTYYYDFRHKYKNEIILSQNFYDKYYNINKILKNQQMQIFKCDLTANNYNQYKTALKLICQITINPNSNYKIGSFDLFYFLYMTAYIDHINKNNNIPLLFSNQNILSKIITKMCFC
jgi:hypothetical protein